MFDAARSNSAVSCRNLRTRATSMPNIPFASKCRTMAEKFLLYVTLITRHANYLRIKMFDVARSNSAVLCRNLRTSVTSMPNFPFASKCRTMAEKFQLYVTLITRYANYLWIKMFDAARSNSAVSCRNLRTRATSMPNIPFASKCRTMAENFLVYVTLITRYANNLWIKMFDVARSNSAVPCRNLRTWATSMPNIPFASKCRTMVEKFLLYVTLISMPVECQREWQGHWGVQI